MFLACSVRVVTWGLGVGCWVLGVWGDTVSHVQVRVVGTGPVVASGSMVAGIGARVTVTVVLAWAGRNLTVTYVRAAWR